MMLVVVAVVFVFDSHISFLVHKHPLKAVVINQGTIGAAKEKATG